MNSIYSRLGLVDVSEGRPEPGDNWTEFSKAARYTPQSLERLGYITASMVIETSGLSNPPAFDNTIIRFGEAMDPPAQGQELDIFRAGGRRAVEDREFALQASRDLYPMLPE